NHERVLMLTFGTGIGVAFCHRGDLYRAGGVYHPEMGHVIVDSEGPACYCNHVGCFESLWSGAAINRRAVDLGYRDFDELYQATVIRGHDFLARVADGFDRWILAGVAVRGTHGTTELAGRALRLLQTGNLQTYAFLFALGVGLILYLVLF
ncbi:MAG TPA: ROK family protein, partial [Verrucomicrobiota bacterium]|nr:ROK family protein [Verrucomicrobiota bacterium]